MRETHHAIAMPRFSSAAPVIITPAQQRAQHAERTAEIQALYEEQISLQAEAAACMSRGGFRTAASLLQDARRIRDRIAALRGRAAA